MMMHPDIHNPAYPQHHEVQGHYDLPHMFYPQGPAPVGPFPQAALNTYGVMPAHPSARADEHLSELERFEAYYAQYESTYNRHIPQLNKTACAPCVDRMMTKAGKGHLCVKQPLTKQSVKACQYCHDKRHTCVTATFPDSIDISKAFAKASWFAAWEAPETETETSRIQAKVRRESKDKDIPNLEFPPNWKTIVDQHKEHQTLRRKTMLDVQLSLQEQSDKIENVDNQLEALKKTVERGLKAQAEGVQQYNDSRLAAMDVKLDVLVARLPDIGERQRLMDENARLEAEVRHLRAACPGATGNLSRSAGWGLMVVPVGPETEMGDGLLRWWVEY
ncbi:hypothetical protein NM208_g16912 [Fusarium decemcellulare]|uniref:Uncharacterized protein n=1 Tax=Fusarium decemcellulare TaxID=57161 RepID=A0ACC1RBH4_9HYPO|nr:hypothetical protein NM208_g16912 [Fusarium decemcellulare]